MHSDPVYFVFASAIFLIALLGISMRRFKQPHVIVYILVGVILGPHGIGVIQEQELLQRAGMFGVILLLFFIGMEASPKHFLKNWSIPVFGTLLQIAVSVLGVSILGMILGWPFVKILFLGFVISLSSTAVVLKLLEDWKELNTKEGQNVLGILLIQDLLIVPMLISLEFLGGLTPSNQMLIIQIIGGICIIALAIWLLHKDEIRLPFIHHIEKDHEMQLFVALGFCFGMAVLTSSLSLSAPLGAFIGGMIVSTAKQTHWVSKNLSPIRTIFLAIFFISVGTLIRLNFIYEYWAQVLFLVIAATLTNTLINAVILRTLGRRWNTSFYCGSLLSQIGEFSFVIASVGLHVGIVTQIGYELTISVISLTLILSPIWVAFIKKITRMTEDDLVRID